MGATTSDADSTRRFSRLNSSSTSSSSSARFEQKRFFSGPQTDYYRVLGVKNDSSHDEIKAAYKKLALEFHPDRNTAAGAEDKFKQISEAYSVVGNKSKRKDYDSARAFGTPGFGSSQSSYNQGSSSSSSSSQTYGAGPNYGPGFGQTYSKSNPFTQHTGQQHHQQVRYEKMSTDEANKLFRDLFGGIQVDQIFREFEQSTNHRRSMQAPFQQRMRDFPAGQQAFRPFFREDSSKVFTDEFGNRTEERSFTSANGTRYTVRNTASTQDGASSNQTSDEFYRNAANQRKSQDGRASFGTASFNVKPPSRDFGSFFGAQTHGRHPMVGVAIIIGWSIVITTVVFGVFNFALAHPIFVGALMCLYFARRGRFG
ncbi:DNA-J chaperone, putative [Bodo saltans]|uniref:DNA-J chaperone, putative n=1 Tax=Bodo saltans TaxID=75058 RepID=A0A0S4JV26_BODSA|nr:DNA-J chaperone, putative [Bodo saltans]|eukprot:CUG94092.1 DNA-J chaperone, putative [Bodo saltans]